MNHATSSERLRDYHKKIRNLRPFISELLSISGCPGLSVGILHGNGFTYTDHFGRRDCSKYPSPDDETIYRIASLSKPITVGVVASLVDEGILCWTTPIREYLPEFYDRKDEVGEKTTLLDLLSNRTGLAIANALWGQKNGIFLLSKDDIVPTSCFIPAVKPFRKSFLYRNWNYALATEVAERVTGKGFARLVKEKILDHLDMPRTTFGMPEDDNMCSSHAVGDDGSPHIIPFINYSDRTGMAGGGAGKSTIKDLLAMYRSILFAYNHQMQTGLTSTLGSPFKQMQTMFLPQIKSGSLPLEEQGYCLGLYKTRLPGRLGVASPNTIYLGSGKMPSFGVNSTGLQIWHHTAILPGCQASSFFVPSTGTAIVVVANAMGLSDPTDGIGQRILSILLNERQDGDFVQISKAVNQRSLHAYDLLKKALACGMTKVPPRHPLKCYEGDYYNSARTFVLSIISQGTGLLMIVQRDHRVTYRLLPYDGNTFYWPADRQRELCEEAMYAFVVPDWHKITFNTSGSGEVDTLIWGHDTSSKPEAFARGSKALLTQDLARL